MSDPVILTLRRPIKTFPLHEDDFASQLTFREPTGADMAACGAPGAKTIASPEWGAYIRSMISRLAGIPESSVDRMQVHDWQDAMNIIMRFLAPPKDTEKSLQSISTPDTP